MCMVGGNDLLLGVIIGVGSFGAKKILNVVELLYLSVFFVWMVVVLVVVVRL